MSANCWALYPFNIPVVTLPNCSYSFSAASNTLLAFARARLVSDIPEKKSLAAPPPLVTVPKSPIALEARPVAFAFEACWAALNSCKDLFAASSCPLYLNISSRAESAAALELFLHSVILGKMDRNTVVPKRPKVPTSAIVF